MSLIGLFVLSLAPPLAETAIAARAPAATAAAPETDAIAPNPQVGASFWHEHPCTWFHDVLGGLMPRERKSVKFRARNPERRPGWRPHKPDFWGVFALDTCGSGRLREQNLYRARRSRAEECARPDEPVRSGAICSHQGAP